eukprot:826535-Rhodomonas_salina.3
MPFQCDGRVLYMWGGNTEGDPTPASAARCDASRTHLDKHCVVRVCAFATEVNAVACRLLTEHALLPGELGIGVVTPSEVCDTYTPRAAHLRH